MKRREFIKGSLAASTLAGVTSLAVGEEKGQNMQRDYYELRAYRLKAGANHDRLDNYLEKQLSPHGIDLGSNRWESSQKSSQRTGRQSGS
jgi:hypothetical protein